jgi:hypothetical protein
MVEVEVWVRPAWSTSVVAVVVDWTGPREAKALPLEIRLLCRTPSRSVLESLTSCSWPSAMIEIRTLVLGACRVPSQQMPSSMLRLVIKI